jgi:hypothetical protein
LNITLGDQSVSIQIKENLFSASNHNSIDLVITLRIFLRNFLILFWLPRKKTLTQSHVSSAMVGKKIPIVIDLYDSSDGAVFASKTLYPYR